jgi:hypothetical protein
MTIHETKRVEVHIYPNADDPVIDRKQQRISINANAGTQSDVHVISCRTTKSLGAEGTFTIDLKEPRGNGLLERLVDDDWLDVVCNVNGARHHVMRGQIADFRANEGVSGGATTNLITITGRDFQRVLGTRSKVWYNQWRGENAGQAETLRIFDVPGIVLPPDETVQTILFGFLSSLTRLGRAAWRLPSSIPEGANLSVEEAFRFVAAGFTNDPDRISIDLQMMSPTGQTLWDLAMEWSDPVFCELFTDLVDRSTSEQLIPERVWSPDTTAMGILFRDRPFISEELGLQSPWFRLPTAIVQPQEIVGGSVGRGGAERFNAFFVTPNMQYMGAQGIDLAGPFWSPADIEKHGLQRLDVQSHYTPRGISEPDQAMSTYCRRMRKRAADFHVLNPYLWNGSLVLSHVRPDIRIGQRVRIPGSSPNKTRTYYVESVEHDMGFPGVTTLGVTRGWHGTDSSQLAALSAVLRGYEFQTLNGPMSAVDGAPLA